MGTEFPDLAWVGYAFVARTGEQSCNVAQQNAMSKSRYPPYVTDDLQQAQIHVKIADTTSPFPSSASAHSCCCTVTAAINVTRMGLSGQSCIRPNGRNSSPGI